MLVELALALPLAVSTQAAAGDPQAAGADRDERALEGFRAYLARRPHDEHAFERLYALAVERGSLPELLADARARAEAGTDLAARVLLARLLVRVGDRDGAARALDGIAHEDAATWRLAGEIALARGHAGEALVALERALERASARRDLEAIHAQRADALCALGRDAEAAQAFGELAALDGASYTLRLRVARGLSAHGLFEPARAHLERAAELARDDPAREARALLELGELEERTGELERALEAYARARALVARGHWMAGELDARALAIQRRSGRLAELREHARAAHERAPRDLAAGEAYAEVLCETGEAAEAAAVLRALCDAHPADPRLAARLRELYSTLGDTAALIAELERARALHPRDVELHFAHGDALADAGQQELALCAWDRAARAAGGAELRGDPATLRRAADACAARGWTAEAVERLREILATDARDLDSRAALMRMLVAADRRDEAAAELRAARALARDDWRDLEVLAGLWRELADLEREREILLAALALEPDHPRLLESVARAHLAAGDADASIDASLRLLGALGDPGQLLHACERAVAEHREADTLSELEARVSRAAERPGADPSARLLLAQVRSRRNTLVAAALLEGLADDTLAGTAARIALAELYGRSDERPKARELLERLCEDDPPRRREHLRALAALLASMGQNERAAERYEELLALAPDDAEAVAEVALALHRLGAVGRALGCLERAAQLAPEELDHPLRIAEWEWKAQDIDAALERLLATLARFPGREAEVAERYWSWLPRKAGSFAPPLRAASGGPVYGTPPVAGTTTWTVGSNQANLGRVTVIRANPGTPVAFAPIAEQRSWLEQRLARTPHDPAPAYLLAYLAFGELDYDAAATLLEGARADHPRHAGLAELAERVHARRGALEDAFAVRRERLRASGGGEAQRDLAAAAVALGRGDRETAERLLERIPDALTRACLFAAHGETRRALELLEAEVREGQADLDLLEAAAAAHEAFERFDVAVLARRRARQLAPGAWRAAWRLDHAATHAGLDAESRDARQQVLWTLAAAPDEHDEIARVYAGLLECASDQSDGVRLFLADCHLVCGRVDEAAGELDALAAADPEAALRHAEAALKWSQYGHHDAALAAVDRAIALDDRQARHHHLRATTLSALGRGEDAALAYVDALRFAPGLEGSERDEWAREVRELVLASERPSQAIEGVLGALTDEPDEGLAALAVELLTSDLQLERALALAAELDARHPHSAPILEQWARALVLSGEFDAAARRYLAFTSEETDRFAADWGRPAPGEDWEPESQDPYRRVCLAALHRDPQLASAVLGAAEQGQDYVVLTAGGGLQIQSSGVVSVTTSGSGTGQTITVKRQGGVQTYVVTTSHGVQTLTVQSEESTPVIPPAERALLRARLALGRGGDPARAAAPLDELWRETRGRWWLLFEVLRAGERLFDDARFEEMAATLFLLLDGGAWRVEPFSPEALEPGPAERAVRERRLAALSALYRARGRGVAFLREGLAVLASHAWPRELARELAANAGPASDPFVRAELSRRLEALRADPRLPRTLQRELGELARAVAAGE